jgi:hypothetical protein
MRDIDLMNEDEDYIEDFDFYSESLRESMLEDDGLSPEEAAFMSGYEEA